MRAVLIHGKFFNSWEAQGLGFIGAYLQDHLDGLDLAFYQGCFDDEDEILTACANAEWVLFSATSPTYDWCASLARSIKQHTTAKTVLGGYHASAVPQLIGPEFDHVVIGYGEWASLQLLTGRRKERIVHGVSLPFEELSWPDRELIRNDRNIGVAAKDTGKRITSFQAHRGCVWGCKYCADGANNVLFGGCKPVLRERDICDLLDEQEHIATNYDLDFLKFCDATWNLRLAWVKDYCRSKMRRGFRTPFFANIHARVCDEEMFTLMAQAGCREIGLGIESGSERILKAIGKGICKDDVRRAATWARSNGIHVRGYFILGVPEEDESDLLETERFVEELELDEVGFTLLCPYPGSHYYATRPELASINWAGVDEYCNDFWHTNTISNARLREVQAQLVERFRRRLTQHQRIVTQPD